MDTYWQRSQQSSLPYRCYYMEYIACSLCLFQASLSIWGWGGLGVVLFLVTFGPFAIFYLAFYIFCFIGGWAYTALNRTTCLCAVYACSFTFTTEQYSTQHHLAVPSFLISRGFAVTLLYGKINSEKHLEKCEHSYLPPTQIGILKVKAHAS